ncbi:MAG: hypothetical protein MUF54_22955 [Polyangiaceae bacterium]|nr:hypothetical protein [Polyangiaceae bacterium]
MRRSGFDGVVESEQGSAFCPAGVSVWELSVEEGAGAKMKRDFRNRTESPPAGFILERTTYIALTARRVDDKDAWAREQAANTQWAGVRVYDADNLASWLETAPAVACWFASVHLSRPAEFLSDISTFLHQWERSTQPPLRRSLLLEGRDDAIRTVKEWLRRPRAPQILKILGDTRQEALAFAAAAIEGETEVDVRDGLLSRAVVAESRDAVRWATRVQGGSR